MSGIQVGARCLVIHGSWAGTEVVVKAGPAADPLKRPYWLCEAVDGLARPTSILVRGTPLEFIHSTEGWFPEPWLMPLDPSEELRSEENKQRARDLWDQTVKETTR